MDGRTISNPRAFSEPLLNNNAFNTIHELNGTAMMQGVFNIYAFTFFVNIIDM